MKTLLWALSFALICNSGFPDLIENEYSIPQLKEVLSKQSHLSTVDALIPVLKSELPLNIRSRYLLIHSSHSLQEGFFDSPRIILFSDDAKFILAMTGKAEARGGDSLEAIQYDDKEEHFNFYHIKHQEGAWHFEENPKKCKMCHTQSLRPNFEGYNLWPGAYGAIDDKIGKKTPEGESFRDFIKTSSLKGRFELLQGLPTTEDLEKAEGFYSISTNREIYSHINSDQWKRIADFDSNYKNNPRANYKFTQEAGRLAIRYFADRLKKKPYFDRLKSAFLNALTYPKGIKKIEIPEEFLKNPGLDIKEYEEKAYKDIYSYRLYVTSRTLKLFGTPKVPFETIEKAVWDKVPAPSPAGDFDYSSVFFQGADYIRAAHLRWVFDSIGEKIDIREIGTSHSHPGTSFTFGNSGLEWLAEALGK